MQAQARQVGDAEASASVRTAPQLAPLIAAKTKQCKLLSDEALMNLVRNDDDTVAFYELYARYGSRSISWANKYENCGEPDDIAQSSWMRIWEARDQWRTDGLRWVSWFTTIMRNLAFDINRVKSARKRRIQGKLVPESNDERADKERTAGVTRAQQATNGQRNIKLSQVSLSDAVGGIERGVAVLNSSESANEQWAITVTEVLLMLWHDLDESSRAVVRSLYWGDPGDSSYESLSATLRDEFESLLLDPRLEHLLPSCQLAVFLYDGFFYGQCDHKIAAKRHDVSNSTVTRICARFLGALKKRLYE